MENISELYSEWIEPFKEFRSVGREHGLFAALFQLLMYLLLTFLCVPVLIIWVPCAFINEKSKEIFR